MRILNIDEVNVVSGGMDVESPDFNSLSQLDGVTVNGKRISFGRLRIAARMARLATPLGMLGAVAGWAWDNHVNSLQNEIDEREKEAKFEPNELEEVVVEGHRQGNVMETVDGVTSWTGRFWLDCDGDGKWDSQYFVDDNGVRWLDFTGKGQWVQVPDRSDWRRGFAG